jgi:hypothetical protein
MVRRPYDPRMADGTLFVDLDGMVMLARRLGSVAVVLDNPDTLTYGLPLERPRLEECLGGVLARRRARRTRLDEDLARLTSDVRSAAEAYAATDEAAAAAARGDG